MNLVTSNEKQELHAKVKQLEEDLQRQTEMNRTILKQMRKLERALMSYKKALGDKEKPTSSSVPSPGK